MKRILAVFTVFLMLFSMLPGLFTNAEAETKLQSGDYVKFGTYHGAAILWRVVDFDAEGAPMLLADQVITSKPFALYNNDKGFNERCWETSYIRTWLNSTSGEGQTKYIVEDDALANPINAHVWDYSALTKEAGFLSSGNFTAAETSILKESKQKDTLLGRYVNGKEGGSQELKFIDLGIAANSALVQKAYYKNVTDKVFLLDAEQFNNIYKKFGDFIITSATYESLKYENNAMAEYIDHYYANDGIKEIPVNKPFDYTTYYLRNIVDTGTSDIFRYCFLHTGFANVGSIEYRLQYASPDHPEYTGVRPACYIDLSKTSIASGTGAKEDPYRFDAQNIYGNKDIENPLPVRVAVFGKLYVKFTDASGIPFVDQSNRTQVPLKLTMQKCGAKVEWDAVNKIAIVSMNGSTVQVPIGQNYILRNGEKIETDSAAMIVNGRTYLPIKPVIEALGGKVRWDADKKVVIINQ